jgi:hypothetical protein
MSDLPTMAVKGRAAACTLKCVAGAALAAAIGLVAVVGEVRCAIHPQMKLKPTVK